MLDLVYLFIFNQICYRAIHISIKWKSVPIKDLNAGGPRRIWVWRNTCCSLVHSVISSIWTVLCIWYKPSLFTELIESNSRMSLYLITSSFAYFVYDTTDVILNNGFKQWEVLIHHAVAMCAFPYCIFSNSYHGFPICALLMEFNSVFLHSRKLFKMSGFNKNHIIFYVNSVFLVITMVLFRILLVLYLLSYSISNKARMDWFALSANNIGAAVLIPTNIGLCYRIYQSDFKNQGFVDKLVT